MSRRLALVAIALLLAAPLGALAFDSVTRASSAVSESVDASPVVRLAGLDRYGTSVAISKATWADQSAGAVVLARGDTFPDALTGAPLAAQNQGPLLINPVGPLRSDIAAEIRRILEPGATVYVLGGLPGSVATSLPEFNVVRIAGSDRYATAVLIAKRIISHAVARNHVFVATGLSFSDALAASAAAAAGRRASGELYPVLLSVGTSMPAGTASYIRAQASTFDAFQVFSAGSQAGTAVSDAFGNNPNIAIHYFEGRDRYETATEIAFKNLQWDDRTESVGLASGEVFPDALGAAAFLARKGAAPLLLTRPTLLPSSTQDAVRPLAVHGGVSVFGGPARVSDAVARTAADLLLPDLTVPAQVDGPAAALSLSAQQTGEFAFDGVKGQRILLTIIAWTFNHCIPGFLWDPSGHILPSDLPGGKCSTSGSRLMWESLPLTGTYHLVLEHDTDSSGAATATFESIPDLPDQPIEVDGQPVDLQFRPGQNGALTFAAPANRKALLSLTESASLCTTMRVYAPSGGVAYEVPCSAGMHRVSGLHVLILPVPGTYKIKFDPVYLTSGRITAQLQSIQDLLPQPIEPDGPPISFSLQPGQAATFTFNAAAGQRMALRVTCSPIAGISLAVRDPNGALFDSFPVGCQNPTPPTQNAFREFTVTGEYRFTVWRTYPARPQMFS